MPLISRSSSTEAKAPLASRYATIASALALPIPMRVVCKAVASALFKFNFATDCAVVTTGEGLSSVGGAAWDDKDTAVNSGSSR
ncbi:hypothetical protein D3C78_1741590 [compost metagenome]